MWSVFYPRLRGVNRYPSAMMPFEIMERPFLLKALVFWRE